MTFQKEQIGGGVIVLWRRENRVRERGGLDDLIKKNKLEGV